MPKMSEVKVRKAPRCFQRENRLSPDRCDMCEVYALHVIEASKVPKVEIPPREVEKAF